MYEMKRCSGHSPDVTDAARTAIITELNHHIYSEFINITFLMGPHDYLDSKSEYLISQRQFQTEYLTFRSLLDLHLQRIKLINDHTVRKT